MANPITGANLASVRTVGTTAATGSNGTNGQCILDGSNEYAYVSMNWNQTTTIASGVDLTQSTIVVGSTTQLLSSGYMVIPRSGGNDLVHYTGTSGGNTLTGCTGGTTTSTGGTIYQAPSIAQVQLSNCTLVSLQWAAFPLISGNQIGPMFFDAANSQIICLSAAAQLYSVSVSGLGGTAGAPSLLNGGASISGVSFLTAGQLIYDVGAGQVWSIDADNNTAVTGFYWKDPSGTFADFTPVTHAMNAFKGGNVWYQSKGGGFAVARGLPSPAHRIAIVYNGTNSLPGVHVWREDLLIVDTVMDDQGACQSTGTSANSASYTGPSMASPQGAAFDAVGNLYILPGTLTAIAYRVPNSVWATVGAVPTATSLNSGSALTHTSSTLVANPTIAATNCYTTSGTLPMMVYADAQAINICD